MTTAVVYGCSGPRLTEAERAFFAEARPWGFILFRRNIETPEQVRALTDDLRRSIGDAEAPVLIDQEGGRVQRMGPPHWPKYPPGAAYLQAANGPLEARTLIRLGARLMAHDLREVGVTVDCAPILDVPVPGAHDIIGDRAYASDPATVAQLARAALGFGKVPDYEPPAWPNEHGTKQFHFDLACDDVEAAETRAVELGATLAEPQPGETWRVLLDPAGHPFCLCWVIR